MQRRAGHTTRRRVVITLPARARVPPVLCNTCTHDAPRGLLVGGDVLRAPKSHADRRGGGDADPRPPDRVVFLRGCGKERAGGSDGSV
jgi:hypothetical protein